MRRGLIPAAAAIALAVVGAGAIALAFAPREGDNEGTIVGYYSPGQEIALGNLSILGGSYRVGYRAEVRFFSPDPAAVLTCGLVDTTGRIGYIGDPMSAVRADGTWTEIAATTRVDVPDISLGLRCSPSSTATIGVAFRGVLVDALPMRG